MLRLFTVPANAIHEHPTDLPVDADKIPDGVIEGWECYATTFATNNALVFGPFNAVVNRPFSDGRPCIEMDNASYPGGIGTRFWYSPKGSLRREQPDWYQSGSTLRF